MGYAFPASRPLIAPSLLSCDFARIADEVSALGQAGADLLHLDVMDGHFVPNITIGPVVVRSIRAVTPLPLDVHLMIEEPDRYIDAFARAGADILTVHQEACAHLHRTVQAIHAAGVLAGVSINPATPVSLLSEIAAEADVILVMSVNPGFGGQRFIPAALDKIRETTALRDARGASHLRIEVDGGVSADNARALIDAGADVLVCGNALFGSGAYADYIRTLRTPS